MVGICFTYTAGNIAVFLIGPVNGIAVSMLCFIIFEKTMNKGEV